MRIPFFGRRERKHKVLLADDDPAIRETTSFVLEKEGYEVRTAKDGAEALQILDTYEADAVILDIMMPKLDGFKTLKAIRGHLVRRKVPVIMFTARRTSEDVMKGYAEGADCYLTKPFRKEQLLESLRQVISAVEDEREDSARKRRIVDR